MHKKERKMKFNHEEIMTAIQSLIDIEDKRNPLPDRALRLLIEEQGIECSQSIITAVRREAGIEASHTRRHKD